MLIKRDMKMIPSPYSLQSLYRKGADIELGCQGTSPLLLALLKGQTEPAEFLISRGWLNRWVKIPDFEGTLSDVL